MRSPRPWSDTPPVEVVPLGSLGAFAAYRGREDPHEPSLITSVLFLPSDGFNAAMFRAFGV